MMPPFFDMTLLCVNLRIIRNYRDFLAKFKNLRDGLLVPSQAIDCEELRRSGSKVSARRASGNGARMLTRRGVAGAMAPSARNRPGRDNVGPVCFG